MFHRAKTKLFPFLFLGFLVIALGGSVGTSENASAAVQNETTSQPDIVVESDDDFSTEEEVEEIEDAEVSVDRWEAFPNVCESFTVVEGTRRIRKKNGHLGYPINYRRNRYKRTFSDQRRTRELIRFVAKEMGADLEGQYLLDMIAFHETSWNPEAIHILNGDLDANQKAWERHSYSPVRERHLESALEKADARERQYWKLKSELADARLYKPNQYWKARLRYTHQIPERTIRGETVPAHSWEDHRSVWAFGYGLYGMNAVLYTHFIGRDAPPWVLCSDEGIVATVVAVWALREQQATCRHLSQKDPKKYGSDGATVRGLIHRWGKGQCGKGTPRSDWQRVMAKISDRVGRTSSKTFAWDSVPNLGSKFPRYEMEKVRGKWRYKKDEQGRRIKTDSLAVIEHMRTKAEETGLLREEPLKRKKPGTAPVVVAKR